jgi:hypothetical protein
MFVIQPRGTKASVGLTARYLTYMHTHDSVQHLPYHTPHLQPNTSRWHFLDKLD